MEREKMIETVMALSPTERQIDMYGCEIGVSRQWYEEATAILIEINEGKYLKIPEDAVVLTKEDLQKYAKDCLIGEVAGYDILQMAFERARRWRDDARKETAKEIFKSFENAFSLYYPHGIFTYGEFQNRFRYLAEKYGVEVEE